LGWVAAQNTYLRTKCEYVPEYISHAGRYETSMLRISAFHGPSSDVQSAIAGLMPANHFPKSCTIIDKGSWT